LNRITDGPEGHILAELKHSFWVSRLDIEPCPAADRFIVPLEPLPNPSTFR